MLIKFFITVFYTGLMSYGSEIFPTDVRSLGSGFTLTFGRLGTLIVPFYINYIKLHYDKNPLSFLTPWTLIAYILCRWMPESETEGLK
jgi:fucose permease